MSEQLYVEDSGTGPVLVLLHAFPCDGRMWQPQAEAVRARGWRVLVPDLPGFGRSPLPDGPPSLPAAAALLSDDLERRGIDRVVLGGISLGGYLAMELLRQQPERVAALVLCDTKATADAPAAVENRHRLAALVEDAPNATARVLEQAVLPGLLGDTTRQSRPSVVSSVMRWLDAADASTVAWYQRAMAARPDSLADLRAAALPTLVVWGEEDALSSRAEQDLMLATSPDAVLAAIGEAGHLSNVERPEAVTRELVRFLEVVAGPTCA